MPEPKTYGELKQRVDELLDQLAAVQENLVRKQGALQDLKGKISGAPDEAPLEVAYSRESASIDKDSAALAQIVNPEEIWNC